MRAPAIVHVGVKGPGEVDGFGVREGDGVVGSGDEVDHDALAGAEVQGLVAVLDGGGVLDVAVEADGGADAGAFHEAKGRGWGVSDAVEGARSGETYYRRMSSSASGVSSFARRLISGQWGLPSSDR